MTSPRLQAAIDRAKYLAERSARNKRSYEVKIARGECGHCAEPKPPQAIPRKRKDKSA